MKETPIQVFERLLQGNARFVSGNLEHPNRCDESKQKSTLGQSPSAIILGCSDSRVPAEIIFDQGIGDLFVVRVAGGILGETQKESILFAVQTFGCPLIFALGHENCGAVQAMRDGQEVKMPEIAEHLSPKVKTAESLEKAVEENVLHVVQELKAIKDLAPKITTNELKVVGGVYTLATGRIILVNLPALP